MQKIICNLCLHFISPLPKRNIADICGVLPKEAACKKLVYATRLALSFAFPFSRPVCHCAGHGAECARVVPAFPVTRITLGKAIVALNGPVEIHIGDIPTGPIRLRRFAVGNGGSDAQGRKLRSHGRGLPDTCPAGRPGAIPAIGVMPGIASGCRWPRSPVTG